MRMLIGAFVVLLLSACSVSLPQKTKADAIWHLSPMQHQAPASEKRDLSLVVAQPWLASGYDTKQVLVHFVSGERNTLNGVVWTENYREWVRNYFIEGLQSAKLFSTVTANKKLRSDHWVLQLFVWDLSVHYPGINSQGTPTVKAKLTFSVSDGRGNRLLPQSTLELEETVSENRVEPIMAGFDKIIGKSFKHVVKSLSSL